MAVVLIADGAGADELVGAVKLEGAFTVVDDVTAVVVAEAVAPADGI